MNADRLKILLEGCTPDGCDCTTAADVYGGGNAIEIESGTFLYGFVRRLRPHVIVETGTHWGFSSAWIGSALADNHALYPNQPAPRLYTIDASSYDGKPARLWERLGISAYIQHIVGDSRVVVLPTILRQQESEIIEKKLDIDLLYLDADHSAESVIAEWDHLAPQLNRQGAWIAFHDTRLDPREADGIRQILESNRAPLSSYRRVQHMVLRNFRGLDLIQVRQEP